MSQNGKVLGPLALQVHECERVFVCVRLRSPHVVESSSQSPGGLNTLIPLHQRNCRLLPLSASRAPYRPPQASGRLLHRLPHPCSLHLPKLLPLTGLRILPSPHSHCSIVPLTPTPSEGFIVIQIMH